MTINNQSEQPQFQQPQQPQQPVGGQQTFQPEGTFGQPNNGSDYGFGHNGEFSSQGAGVNTGDIMDLLAEGGSLLAPVADSELLTKLAEALKARLVSKGKPIPDLTIHLVDQTMARTPVSALAIVYKKDIVTPAKEGAEKSVRTLFFTTTLLLEASASRMSSLPIQYDNRMLELQATVGHVWNNEFWAKIVSSLSKEFGKVKDGQLVAVSETSFVDSCVLVVPKDLNIEDERAIHNLAYNALAAISTSAGSSGRQLNLVSQVLNHNYQLSSNTDFSSKQPYNQLGRAVRGDVVITTSVARNNNNQQQQQQQQNWMFQQNQSSVIAELTGFIDIGYIGQTPAAVQGYGMQPAMGTQCYGAEFVITNAATRFHDLSLEKLLFALVTAFAMEKDGSWAWAFVPRPNRKGGVDQRDIGALGLDVDIKGDGNLAVFRGADGKPMSSDELGTFLNHLFYRNLRFSIDVDPSGVNGWILNDFVRAAQPIPDPAAVSRILNACNQLTNGHFSTLWQQHPDSTKPLACIRGYFNLGEYTDSEGEKRDVRDFDYLASINLLPREGFARYQASVENKQCPVPVALATQQELISSVWTNASFYGVGTRVAIAPAILQCLSQAIALAGIALRPENQRTSAWGNVTTRGDASMLQWGVSGVGNNVYNWHAANGNQQQFGSFGGRLSGYGF